MSAWEPRVARMLLRSLLPFEEREEVLCDLEERYESRVIRLGHRAAARWYRRQAFSLALWGVARRMGRSRSGRGLMDGLWDHGVWADIRVGLRSLSSNPGYAAVAVVTLALGIGGNTAVFSVVDGVLLRPLPYAEADQLVAIHETRVGQSWWSAAPANAIAWRERSRAFQDVAWAQARRLSFLPPSGEPEALRAVVASWNLFDLLRVEPILGRTFREGDDQQGAEPVVILTYDTWANRYAGNPAVLGRGLDLDGIVHTLVGVLPQGREASFFGAHEVILPRILTETDILSRGRILRTIGRLAPDVDLDGARAEMDVLGAELDAETPANQLRGFGVHLVPLKEQMIGDVRTPLIVLLGAVGFVLLVACANLSNLVLARASARRTELAVRAALGAARGHLVRHLLTESTLVAVLGGAVGLVLAAWATNVLLAVDPSAIPRLTNIEADGRMLAFTLAVSVAAVMIFGLVPAVQLTRSDPGESFPAGGARGGSSRKESRLRSGLVAAEVVLVATLLVGAGIMIRSLEALGAVDPGFDTEGRIAVRLSLPAARYPDGESLARFTSQLVDRAREIPGVLAAGMVTTLPLSGGPGYTALQVVRSQTPPEAGSEPIGGMEVVSPGYFEAMGIPLLAGRDFIPEDMTSDLPTVIVDRAVVDRFWTEGDPLTDAVRMAPAAAGDVGAWREIVGVVGPVRYGLDADPRPRIYVPEGQVAFSLGPRTLVVHVAPASLDAVVPALQLAVRQVDPSLPLERIERLEEVSRGSIARTRLQTALLAIFAAIALGLGAVGVYGVVSYSVARRSREIGLRLALGATRGSVVKGVLRAALTPVLVGLAVGLAAAGVLSRTLGSITFGVEPLDPLAFGAAPVLLLVVACAAALIPGLRASRVDPMKALSEE